MLVIIDNYIDNNCNIAHVNFELQEQIITSYLADMNKYTENSEVMMQGRLGMRVVLIGYNIN